MLVAGSDDGVYRISGVLSDESTDAQRILDAHRVFRVRRFDATPGLFVAAESGLYYSPDGHEWASVAVPEPEVTAVVADPTGERLYVGTRPARVFEAEVGAIVPTDERSWTAVEGFDSLRKRTDWGLPRHDGVAQVRSLCTHPDAPSRLIAGIEVGGIHVSEDGGETWQDRSIEGFDAPHTDDIHQLFLQGPETVLAATGSGLYRTTSLGREWTRLDSGHPQGYFRAAFGHDGRIYAGGAPGSPASWETETDHALFESANGSTLERIDSPRPEEVAIGWTAVSGTVVAATHRGSLLARREGGWEVIGSVPTAGEVEGRYLPLEWYPE
ncbi:MAG: WD40/YVTN/BNR-like repeat-containing protein [Halodesulfurarchaeum sp.]